MTETTKQWRVGSTFWQASASLHGRPWDICASECETRDEAMEEAENWASFLSEREMERARYWVRQYRVLTVEEDGSIGAAVTCD